MSTEQVYQAQAAMQESFLSRANVVGVAVGNKTDKTVADGEKAVVVLVERKLPLAALAADDVIPSNIDGVRTDVYEVGYLRAFQAPTERFRPTIPCGVSIGHFAITAGTLGAIVTDRNTGDKLILSNNHVLANSNNAQIGDPILQPGPTDGGQNPADVVAHLERFITLHYVDDPTTPPPTDQPPSDPNGGCLLIAANILNMVANLLSSQARVTVSGSAPQTTTARPAVPAQVVSNLVDCALARPVDPNMFTGEILGIGAVSGTKAASLGQTVRKSGRTTGLTTGTVTLLNATVNVAYGTKTARFTGQVITTPMSQGGDSGSLVVDGSGESRGGAAFRRLASGDDLHPYQRGFERLTDRHLRSIGRCLKRRWREPPASWRSTTTCCWQKPTSRGRQSA